MSWNGSSNKGYNNPIQTHAKTPAKRSGVTPVVKGVVGGVIVVVGTLVTFLFLRSGANEHVEEPALAQKPVTKEIKHIVQQPVVDNKAVAKPQQPMRPKKARKDMTPEERYQFDLEHVREAQKRMANIPRAYEPKPQIFTTSSDQVLAMIAQTAEGRDPGPIPLDKSFEKEFIASLKEPIVINEDDSDKVKAMKESVARLREELSERAAAGESPHTILQEYIQHMAEDYKTRSDVQREAREILESGDREGAKKYVNTMNIALQQMGIKKIDMPMTQEERRAWAENYIKEREAEKAAQENADKKGK